VEIQELRNYQQNNILEEVKKLEQSILENTNIIDSLGMEVKLYLDCYKSRMIINFFIQQNF